MSERLSINSYQSTAISRRLSFFCRAVFFLFTVHCLLLTAAAQTEEMPPDDIAPPPLKILSKTERAQLEAEKDIKDRTKLALELMETRLLNAESYNAKEEFGRMFEELGSFHALMDNTLDFLSRNNNDSGRILNNFKRIEINLRKYITRLELIRRELPVKYERYVRQLTKVVRDARTRAVEPLFEKSGAMRN